MQGLTITIAIDRDIKLQTKQTKRLLTTFANSLDLNQFQVCMLLYVHSNIAITLMKKRELVALLNLSSWCLVMVKWLFLVVPWGCLWFVIVVFPDHTHLLFFKVH